jgi:hypothetical protein
MPEENNDDRANAANHTVIVGAADGPQAQLQGLIPSTPINPVRHRIAETYIAISLMAMVLLGIVGPIALAIVWVYFGAVPVGVLGLVNVVVLPILLVRKRLSGVYRALGIALLVLSILAVGAGALFIFNVRSIAHRSAQRSKQMSMYYNRQEASARSEATVGQATQLLNSCQIFGFYYTQQDGVNGAENAEKTSTGIVLYKLPKPFGGTTTPASGDAGKYRMHIADRMINTMVPIARNAQHSCGIQFWHDGNYEQYKNGQWYFNSQVVQSVELGKTKEEAISFMQSCKADYFVGYTDINLIKESSTKSWLNKAEQSSTGIEILEGSPLSYVFVSKSMTTTLQETARQIRQTCYGKKKLYITIDNWIETEHSAGTWTRVSK